MSILASKNGIIGLYIASKLTKLCVNIYRSMVVEMVTKWGPISGGGPISMHTDLDLALDCDRKHRSKPPVVFNSLSLILGLEIFCIFG